MLERRDKVATSHHTAAFVTGQRQAGAIEVGVQTSVSAGTHGGYSMAGLSDVCSTTKMMTKITKTFSIIVDETKTKTTIKTSDDNEIEINGILVLTTLTRISEAKFGT